MSETKQEDSKKDLALILARLSNLIEADSQQNTAAANRDFTATGTTGLSENSLSDSNLSESNTSDSNPPGSPDDADENYPELTDVADIDVMPEAYAGIDEAMLNNLMSALKPAIDAAANRAIERILLDAKQPLKQQLELEIRQALLKFLIK